MAAATGGGAGGGSGGSSNHSGAPKILLAKPAGLVTVGKFIRGSGGDDESASLRSRVPSMIGSLNLLSDSWDFQTDRFLPFLTDNTEFTVVGVMGPPGVGKSTIMNELYGFFDFDAIATSSSSSSSSAAPASAGMLPPFPIQFEETRAMARHSTVGIEPRISAERIILLDTQPVFSPSVLAEIIRPDGSSTISVLSGESLSAELAHELMGIQVDLLKHGIPDPSSLTLSHSQSSNLGSEKENKDKVQEGGEDYMATPVFVHTKMHDQDLTPQNSVQLKKALNQYFSSSSFVRAKWQNTAKEHPVSYGQRDNPDSALLNLFLVPSKNKNESPRAEYESYDSLLWKLRDQVLSLSGPSFARTVSEREWLKNSAKIWELVKNSPIIAEYCKTLQSSGFFRR